MQTEIFPGDRRSDRRYDVALELRYRLKLEKDVVQIGRGTTSEISRSSVLFRGDESLDPGTLLDLLVDWPIQLRNTCPLELRISGQVVRTNSRGTALHISRYEFRSRPSRQPLPQH
jgi:hypothetical protein